MNYSIIDVLSRQAATATRRGSLRTLGGAALIGTLAAPTAARAGKSGKKAARRCQSQKAGCEDVVRGQCQGNETCLNAVLPCCALLGKCQGREATVCFLAG